MSFAIIVKYDKLLNNLIVVGIIVGDLFNTKNLARNVCVNLMTT